MFHDGDLTSGISLAISQSKLVAILVRNPDSASATDSYDSRIWEEYWLQNLNTPWDELSGPPFGELVREKAVLLRIDLGSQEAGFLAQFCPISVAPTMVIIKNGQVLEKLERGIGREEFVYRVSKAVGMKVEGPPPPFSNTSTTQTTGPSESEQATQLVDPQTSGTTSSIETPSASIPDQPQSANVRQILQERSQRLDADKAAQDAAAKAERVERARARRKEAEDATAAGSKPSQSSSQATATTSNPDTTKARSDWLQQQHQRKQEAKLERERILKQIENDKQNRKARQQQRLDAAAGSPAESILRTSGAAATASSLRPLASHCSLQIRLFDGSSIRNRFPAEANLAIDVREWITESTSGDSEQADAPYNFRHVVPPKPSRTIEASEEHLSLRDLDLLPSATLVLSPVIGATDAYASAGGGLFGYAYRGAAGILGTVSSYLPALARSNPGNAAEPSSDAAASSSQSKTNTQNPRVQTLADQQPDKPSEFYNGNSLGFEGRDDRSDDKRL